MKKFKVDLKMVFWFIVGIALVSWLILNPLFEGGYRQECLPLYVQCTVFFMFLLSPNFFHKYLKNINLGISMASCFFILIVIILAGRIFVDWENWLDMGGMFFLGYPSTKLTYWVQIEYESLLKIDLTATTQGLIIAILGCTQYFLVGFILEKFYKMINRKSK